MYDNMSKIITSRPLSTRMKDYLRLDVHFLLPCYELLNEQLSKQGIKIEKAFVRYKYPPLTHSGRMHIVRHSTFPLKIFQVINLS